MPQQRQADLEIVRQRLVQVIIGEPPTTIECERKESGHKVVRVAFFGNKNGEWVLPQCWILSGLVHQSLDARLFAGSVITK